MPVVRAQTPDSRVGHPLRPLGQPGESRRPVPGGVLAAGWDGATTCRAHPASRGEWGGLCQAYLRAHTTHTMSHIWCCPV